MLRQAATRRTCGVGFCAGGGPGEDDHVGLRGGDLLVGHLLAGGHDHLAAGDVRPVRRPMEGN